MWSDLLYSGPHDGQAICLDQGFQTHFYYISVMFALEGPHIFKFCMYYSVYKYHIRGKKYISLLHRYCKKCFQFFGLHWHYDCYNYYLFTFFFHTAILRDRGGRGESVLFHCLFLCLFYSVNTHKTIWVSHDLAILHP